MIANTGLIHTILSLVTLVIVNEEIMTSGIITYPQCVIEALSNIKGLTHSELSATVNTQTELAVNRRAYVQGGITLPA